MVAFFTHTPKKQITKIWNRVGAVAVDKSVSARVKGALTESKKKEKRDETILWSDGSGLCASGGRRK